MKRITAVILMLSLVFSTFVMQDAAVKADGMPEEEAAQEEAVETAGENSEAGESDSLELTAPSAILMESVTGKVIYEKNADEQRSPASITKIMTLLLIFEELEKGTLKMEDEVTTSAHAKSMGGSQVFLEEGEKQNVETMIKCIVIASGNDASVAMAEHIAGSESEFVARMNAKAQDLGMKNTNFEDCCGLTDSPTHYTTARDVSIMSRELITKHEKVLEYSSIWMENITHVTAKGSKEFGLTNTNKMIRGYDGCVGLKTGSTSVAKYCVSTVAKRNGITLLSIVMGAPEPKGRFKDASAMLNYGFGKCRLYQDESPWKPQKITVNGALQGEVSVSRGGQFSYLDTEGNNLDNIESKVTLPESTDAPIKKGDRAGTIRYYLNDKEIGSIDICFDEDVEKAGYPQWLKRAFDCFLGKKQN